MGTPPIKGIHTYI